MNTMTRVEYFPRKKQSAEELSLHPPDVDDGISIKKGKIPPFSPLCNLDIKELITQREYLEDNLPKGFMQSSKSSAGVLVHFLPNWMVFYNCVMITTALMQWQLGTDIHYQSSRKH